MDRRTALLAGSLALNLCVVAAGGVVVAKRGGLTFVKYELGLAKAPRPAWEMDWVARNALLPKTEGEVMFLGDSIVARGPWSEYFSVIRNRGVAGETTANVLERLDDTVASRPRALFVQVGTNDLAFGVSEDEVLANYARILDTARAKSPGTKLFVASILPTSPSMQREHYATSPKYRDKPAKERAALDAAATATYVAIPRLNARLAELARTKGATFVDLTAKFADATGELKRELTSGDGLHLSPEGYDVYHRELAPHVGTFVAMPAKVSTR